VIHRFLGLWVLRRAFRLLTADDPRPLRARLTREAKRILLAAAVLLAAVVAGAILLIALLIVAVT
jgi:hypothetical protein